MYCKWYMYKVQRNASSSPRSGLHLCSTSAAETLAGKRPMALCLVATSMLAWLGGVPRALPQARGRSAIVRCQDLADGTWEVSGGRGGPSSLRVAVAGSELHFETGVMARQASGAVKLVQGDTHVFCAACIEKKDTIEPIDFTPLRVDYFERKSSVGRTAGGFIKRDGRPSEHETLVARIIDRPIRPLIADGWSLETQLTAYVLAADETHIPDVMAACAASAALAISEVCHSGGLEAPPTPSFASLRTHRSALASRVGDQQGTASSVLAARAAVYA